MLAGDSKSAIDRRLFDDPRVTTFWDPGRLAGDWLAAHRTGGVGQPGLTVWDAFFAFRATAHWGGEPSGLIVAASPIIASTAALDEQFVPLLK
jgi:hypothetical protein